jgi:hypothetical protein
VLQNFWNGPYVDDYIKSGVIRNDLRKAILEFCQNDTEFVAKVRSTAEEVVDQKLREAVQARLEEVKVGDITFTDWLVRVALKESLTSEVVRQAIDSTVKARIEEVMRKVLANGLLGLSGNQS